jgi:hypothetical protein
MEDREGDRWRQEEDTQGDMKKEEDEEDKEEGEEDSCRTASSLWAHYRGQFSFYLLILRK